jgi:hypothetical protein
MQSDLDVIKDKVVAAHYKSIHDFEQHFRASIKSYKFEPGMLVLVRNLKVEYELSKKTKPQYLGPMVVMHCTKGGSYMLAELDSVISKLCFAAFHVSHHPIFSVQRRLCISHADDKY